MWHECDVFMRNRMANDNRNLIWFLFRLKTREFYIWKYDDADNILNIVKGIFPPISLRILTFSTLSLSSFEFPRWWCRRVWKIHLQRHMNSDCLSVLSFDEGKLSLIIKNIFNSALHDDGGWSTKTYLWEFHFTTKIPQKKKNIL